jgi:nicotinate-nucleotide pyrophosphorylase (carboxylating)
MQRLSGIATQSRHLSILLKDYHTTILDTRKTTPGMRLLEKWAVKLGGCQNHRIGLYDMIMIKDNHIDFAGGIKKKKKKTHQYLKFKGLDLPIEIETRNLDEVKEVLLFGGVNRIMLDNFKPDLLKDAVELIGKRFETEASGGITMDTILDFAATGVDYISVGALTHSSKSVDLSLRVEN